MEFCGSFGDRHPWKNNTNGGSGYTRQSLQDMDMRLIRALRLLNEKEACIGEKYDGDFLQSYVGDFGLDPAVGDPARGRMPCTAWHHPHSCKGTPGRGRGSAPLALTTAYYRFGTWVYVFRDRSSLFGLVWFLVLSFFSLRQDG